MTDQTLVTFLLDRTQSMHAIKSATIESFNAYLDELRKANDIRFSLITFDKVGIDKLHFEADPKQVPNLTNETYQPRSMTNLIEAATVTIRALEHALAQKTDKPKVVMCIQTDGEENCSPPDYTWDSLKSLIEAKQKDGWQFNFMGAGIDAYQQAARMGVAVADTMSYDSSDLASTRASFTASASNTRNFAAGLASNTNYSMSQKLSSGDKFDPVLNLKKVMSGAAPAASVPLDLTSQSTVIYKSPTDLDLTH